MLRACAAVALALAAATCRDAVGPRGTVQGRVAVAPILPSDAALAVFGLAIDQIRIVVVRPVADTLADTTVALPPDATFLDLDLHVALVSSPESLDVTIEALSGTVPLFTGTSRVEVRSGGGTPTPTEIAVDSYIGPGAGVDSIAITPRSPFIYLNDSLRFQVQAFTGGVVEPLFYVAWTTSDTTIARVNGFGVLRAPNARTSVRVRARTPSGAIDSVAATFVPLPTQMLVVAGGGQTGAVGQPLATQLEVELRALDNLPVGGVAVRFRSLSGGSPADTIVTTDVLGRARVTGVLGATPGSQTFQASLPDFPSVTAASFGANATSIGISPATSIVTVASGSVVSGNTVKLRLQGKDAAGNDVTTGGAAVVFTRAGGSSTGSIGATADSGNGVYTAVFTGVLAGTATTIGATITGSPVTTALPTIAVSPGGISASGSLVSVSNGTVVSGAAVTLRLRGKDAAGNDVPTGGATVDFSSSGGTSTGTIGAAADSGNGVYTAAFTGVLAGTGTAISATVDGSPVTSGQPSIVVTPGAPAQLAFVATPSVAATGVVIAPPVEVAARDLAGNPTPVFGGNVTIAIGTNPSSGSLAGTLMRTASAGAATFDDLAIDLPGIGYTLVATASGLGSDTTASFDVVPPAGTIFWANASGGNWSNPANWTGGVVPSSIETAAITIPGTYTVTLDVGDTIAGLQLGGSSGSQTLVAASKTLHVSGTTQINANGLLDFRSSILAGGTLSNGGTVLATGPSTISPLIVTSSTSLIRIQGNGTYGLGTLSVTNSFTNNGAIVLTDTTSSYGATLSMPVGATLTNGAGGTIDAAVGAAGARTLALTLDNQGTLTLSRALALNRASAAHVNTGTINVSAGDFTISQSGTGPSFTTSGAIAIGAGRTMLVSSGAFDYAGGTMVGPGTLALTGVTATITPALSTGSVSLTLTSSTVGGGGSITVAPSTAFDIRSSTVNLNFLNQGFVTATGASVFNGAVTNAAGATLRIQGNGTYGLGTLSVTNGFTNNGAIVLTDTTSSYGATLSMPAGETLTNAASGTIDAAVGFAGARTLALALDNQGTVTLNRPLTINRAAAAHTNSGTIDVSGGDLTLTQSGTGPTFTTSGTITIGPARTFAVSGGAFNYTSGTISGGTLSVSSTAVTSLQPFNTATAALTLISSTWGGSGTITVGASTTLDVRSSTISAPLVNQASIRVAGSSAFNGGLVNPAASTVAVQGNGTYGLATLTVATSFTNGGVIVLTDTTSSYGATLSMPAGATLTNAPGGTIDAATGFAGARTLALELDNQGTVTLNRPLTLNGAGAAHLNSGTIDVSGGDFTLTQSGATPSFATSGSIAIAPGRTFSVSGGAFNYTAGTIDGGGTLSLTSTTVTATQSYSTAVAALSIVSSTWGGAGTLTIATGTSLLLRASAINSTLANEGTLVASGGSTINGAFTNVTGATVRVQGNGTYGLGTLTIATAFSNDGAIELTDTTSAYGATLQMPAGQTLTNASGGTISALLGFNGPRTLAAELDNRGVITVATAPNQALTINRASAQHQNRGSIVLSGGDLTVAQSGTSPSFRNAGTITVAAGDTFHVTGGSFVHDSGTISGAGGLTLANLTGTGAFNITHSIAFMAITSSTVSFATPQTTGATGFLFVSAVINGPGQLTNAAGQFLNVRASTINADLDNQGTLLVNGGSNFTGALTTSSSSLIRVQGNGTYGVSTMAVSNAFTNNGTIELTDTTSAYGATLNAAAGTLTNSPTGTITAALGALGPRTLSAQLDNQGVLSVALASNGSLTLGRSGAVHQNSSVIDVTGGDLVVNQSVGGSLTNTGSITVATGDTLTVNGGSLAHNGGTFGGAGALELSGVNTAFNVAQTFGAMLVNSSTVAFATPQATTGTDFSFTGSFIDGPGPVTNDVGKTLPLHSTVVRTALRNFGTVVATGPTSFTTDTLTTVAGSRIRIQGNGTYGSANVTVTKGFENAGTIELTDTLSAYGSSLSVPNGRLINLPGGIIGAATGANGPRTLTADLDNQGTLAVALAPGRDLLLNRVGSAYTNTGTIDVTGGDLVIGSAASFQNLGAINLGGTDTLSITGGTFSYDAGTLGSGTLVLSSVVPANFNKSHTLSSIVLNNTTATFAPAQTTASTDFTLTTSLFNGPGTLTNAAGKTLRMRGSGISAPFINQGTVVATAASSLDALTTVAGSTLRVEGDGTSGVGTLTVNGGMLNNGTVELTDVGSAYGATLVVKTLPLVNAGTIDILPGANGPRTIDAVLDNQGTFTANQGVTISHPDAQHTNRGTFKVKAGAIAFAQSGTNESFTNQAGGVIDIDAGTVFRVTNGPVTNALGGKILGFGTLDVRPPATFSNDGEIIPGASPGKLTIAGNMQIPTTGIITIELGGPTPGTEYDELAITGAALFAEGTLNVSIIGAFDPKGLSFDVMTFGPGSFTGVPRNFTVPPACNQPVNTGTSIRVVCP
jgi:hypothetical protein